MGPQAAVFEGKTLDDAVRKGLESLNLSRAEAMITILEEGSGGFLGLGARPYKVRVMRRPGGAIPEAGESRGRGERGGRGRDRGRGGEPRREERAARGTGAREERGGRARDDRGGRTREERGGRGREERRRPERTDGVTAAPREGRPERHTRGGRDERAPREAREVRPQEPVAERPAEPWGEESGGDRARRRRRRGGRGRGGRGREGEREFARETPEAGSEHEPMTHVGTSTLAPPERAPRAERAPEGPREPGMPAEQLAAEAQRMTEDLLKAMGFEATVSARAEEDRADVSLSLKEHEDLLTGPKGEVRQAIQHLLNLMINRGQHARYHVQLEVNDFWQKRETELTELARRLAEECLSTGNEAVTEYLNSQERRVIHVTLREDTRVKTYALGTGLIKRVAVAPADFAGGPRDDEG